MCAIPLQFSADFKITQSTFSEPQCAIWRGTDARAPAEPMQYQTETAGEWLECASTHTEQ